MTVKKTVIDIRNPTHKKIEKFDGDSAEERIWESEAGKLILRYNNKLRNNEDPSDICEDMYDHIQDRIRNSELEMIDYSVPEEEKAQVRHTDLYRVLTGAINAGHCNPNIADKLTELLGR